jgi:hypothetical protein
MAGSSQVNDMPDDYQWLPGSNRSSLADLGELAVRLGALTSYDRRGEVIWQDDMSNGLSPWYVDTVGTASVVTTTDQHTDAGPYAILLTSGTTAGDRAGIRRGLAPFNMQRLGMEVSVQFDTLPSSWTFVIQRYTPTGYFEGMVMYNGDTYEVSILVPALGFVVLCTLPPSVSILAHYDYFKLVIDQSTGKYVRLLVNQTEYDISSYSLYTHTAVYPDIWYMSVYNHNHDGTTDTVHIGHVIITANEP